LFLCGKIPKYIIDTIKIKYENLHYVKRKISKQKKELKYLEEELKDLIETSKELPKRNKI